MYCEFRLSNTRHELPENIGNQIDQPATWLNIPKGSVLSNLQNSLFFHLNQALERISRISVTRHLAGFNEEEVPILLISQEQATI